MSQDFRETRRRLSHRAQKSRKVSISPEFRPTSEKSIERITNPPGFLVPGFFVKTSAFNAKLIPTRKNKTFYKNLRFLPNFGRNRTICSGWHTLKDSNLQPLDSKSKDLIRGCPRHTPVQGERSFSHCQPPLNRFLLAYFISNFCKNALIALKETVTDRPIR